MKIGVKTYDNEEFLDYFKDKADFFEVQAIQTNNYDFLKKYSLPIIIHAEHHVNAGINPADKTLINQNLKSINFAIKLADQVNAKKIIFHPGMIRDANCSQEQAINFIKNIPDDRILIENLPAMPYRLGKTPKELKEFLQKTGKKFCFDLSHAIVTANILKLDKERIIEDFLKLNPVHFHLSGQNWDADTDHHWSFKDSNIDFKNILKFYPKDAEITLEVTQDIGKNEYDLEYIKEIISSI